MLFNLFKIWWVDVMNHHEEIFGLGKDGEQRCQVLE